MTNTDDQMPGDGGGERGKCQWFWEKADACTGWLVAFLSDPVPHPLAKVHWVACFAMFVQAGVAAIVTALFSNRFGQAIDFKRKHLFTMPVSPLVPCFMAVAGMGHFVAARSGLFARITQHKGWSRWLEKAISVGLMYGMVALLCDKEAAVPLLWLILLNGCSMGIRFVMERDIEHSLFGSGRHSNPVPRPISGKNVLARFAESIEESVALVAPAAKPSDDDDDEAPDVPEAVLKDAPPPKPSLSADWEVISSSLVMDLIALGMFLPYYIDNVQNERWFVHASVATLIVTVFGYTGLLLLYRRAALKLKEEGELNDVVMPEDKDDRRKWEDQVPDLKRSKLDAQYEQLETWLIGWSVLTTSGLGWIILIAVVQ